MSRPIEPLGRHKLEIDTPALLLDMDLMERNLKRMADFCRSAGCNLRPHIKTHKAPELARRQVAEGAIGIACQKLEEAEVFVEHGLDNILITYQVVTPEKIRRLIELSKRAMVIVCADDAKNIKDLSEAAMAEGVELNVLVELNVGHNRCGVEPGEPGLELTQKVLSSPGLNFRGLMGYMGPIMFEVDREKREAGAREATGMLVETRKLLEKKGIEVEICSAGGTGTYDIDASFPGVSEIQPGSYLTMDARYKNIVPEFGNALSILTTVVSRPAKERAILDTGLKSTTPDFLWFGFPIFKEESRGIEFKSLNEEHCILGLTDPVPDLKLGDKVE
ncbi:MAG: DSD1 family PLP-dependent enzyme, partial [Nitrospinota bacterium]